MNSIKLWNKMDAIFMIPEIVKHLIFADFYLTFQKKTKQWICCFIKSYCLLYMDKFKKSYENNKYKISALTLKKSLSYLKDHILYLTFTILLGIFLKNMEHNTSAYLDYLIDLSLQGVNWFLVLSFKNSTDGTAHTKIIFQQ